MNFGSLTKVCLTTLGCDKNRADSEQLAGYLRNAGLTFVDNDDDADLIIINTCGFINSARRESIEVITSKLCHRTHAKIVVCGCIVENNREELSAGLPEVDLWWGTKDYAQLANLITKKLVTPVPKLLSTPPSYVYIKIADGCNRRCAFCTIPSIRGQYVSRPLDEILAEVSHFATLGVPEFILVAQDVTMYGIDIQTNLVTLLRQITAIPGVKRVRLHYCYPDLLSETLLQEIATNSKIVKYLDIPFQHGAEKLLKLMHRRGNAEQYRQLVKHIRKLIPDVTLRATFIVGFPTETEEDFQLLLEFLKDIKLDYAGFFAYSREPGTEAYALPQVPAVVKRQRLKIAKQLQAQILANQEMARIGTTVTVVCDSVVNGVATCRMFCQSPDVDPCIRVKGNLLVGQEYQIILQGVGRGKLI